jgi:hypothetical protein
MKWHFSPQLSDQVETEITQRDQFDNDDVDISETIVREAIQNSLDAAVDDPCRVKVTFRWIDKEHGLCPEFIKSLFDGQKRHAEAAEIDTSELDFDNPKALVIEDFGTCGLTGSINSKDNEHFSDFWRRHGKSHKKGKSRGRWGLGKLVYSTTSRIGAFFGVTRRKGDDSLLLMGQTVLNLRTVDEKEYPPHAFFADLENKDDIYRRIPVPVQDTQLVDDFCNNFSIQRGEEPGLSVVIPFPNPAFDVESMISVAMANYFYPLVTGQLVLQFNDLVIDQQNVREMTKKYAEDRFHQIDILFDFIEKVYTAESGQLLELKPSWIDDKKLDADDFDEATLESIRNSFSQGELVALSLPITIKKKDGTKQETKFSVYIKRPQELTKGRDLYVRGGLTLPAEAKFRDRRALGAMIAEDEPICSFLGDAENAAHTQWTTNTEKLRRNFQAPQPIVGVIKKSVIQLYDLLAEVTEDEDEDALQDFFWFDEPDAGTKKKRKKPKPPRPIGPITPKSPSLLQLGQIDGGFHISNTDDLSADKLPKEITVTAAYDVSKGSAFKKYSSHDFTVGKNGNITTEIEGNVKVISSKENTWTLEAHEVPFKFKATGFDINRDLKIKFT